MMKIPNIQFTSPEADRKVMLWVSIVLMVLFWIILAVICLAMWSSGLRDSAYWDATAIAIVTFLSVTVVLLIPFQLVRYFRELRKLRASK
jgi:membrane protein YdbS with pleckstrin-like domain